MDEKTTEVDPQYLSPDDLKELALLCERVSSDAEWACRRLVVEVWDKGDGGPVAWIEHYPGDSSPTVRFGPEHK